MSSKRTPQSVITGSLDTRRDAESDVQPRIYVRPVGRTGFHIIRRECNSEEVVVSGARAFAPGTQVNTARHSGRSSEAIITEPPPGRRGASAFPLSPFLVEVDVLRITSADPAIVEAGFSGPVDLHGIGFNESPVDLFVPVVFNPATGKYDLPDPYTTIGAATWTSAELVTVPITVLSSAPESYWIAIDPRRA